MAKLLVLNCTLSSAAYVASGIIPLELPVKVAFSGDEALLCHLKHVACSVYVSVKVFGLEALLVINGICCICCHQLLSMQLLWLSTGSRVGCIVVHDDFIEPAWCGAGAFIWQCWMQTVLMLL